MMKRTFPLFGRFARALDRWHPSESVVLGGAALAVGLMAGVGVWAFKSLIAGIQLLTFGKIASALSAPGSWTVFLIPIVGGLLVGLIVHLLIGPERHHGVAGIMEAVALAGGRLRYRRIPAKAIAAALSIGVGASVGPEDPSVQIGANLASMLGQVLHLSDDRVRGLVAAGAAGGIAAAFNAPIAGIFFSLEVILGELSGSAVGVVTLAAVVSAVFIQAVSRPEPAFHVPAYAFNSAWELLLYLGLGLLAGPLAAVYIRALYLAQDAFHQLRVPRWIKPAIAGLGLGLVGIVLPQVFGVGYNTIEQTLNTPTPALGLLLALLLAKLVLTPVSIGGGFPGGVFAPSLFLGATLGAAYGTVAERLFPGMDAVAPGFALVGMAAVLAGSVRAPLTAIILLFEMTNDYRIILPLMFAVVVSVVIARQLQPNSVYELGLARKGVRLERGRDVEVLEGITVGEAMRADMPSLRESDSLEAAGETLRRTRHHGLTVLNEAGELAGIFTIQDLDRAQNSQEPRIHTVGEACTREILTAYPDESIGAALRRMGVRDVGRLPVVARNNPRQLLGVLRRADIVRIYDIALTRRAAIRHQAQEVRLGAGSDLHVEEVTVEPGAPCAGRRVSEVAWPRDVVVATVRRKRQTIVPHGDTVLRAGDVVVLIGDRTACADARGVCLSDGPERKP